MIVIEPFLERDALELVRIWRASFEHGVGVTDPYPLHEQVAFLLDGLVPKHAVRIARRDGDIVGFVASNAESVAALYVGVPYLGLGIGSLLLDVAKEHSAGALWLYTFARNANARRFYAKHGFAEVEYGFEPNWQLEDVRLEWQRIRPP